MQTSLALFDALLLYITGLYIRLYSMIFIAYYDLIIVEKLHFTFQKVVYGQSLFFQVCHIGNKKPDIDQ